VAAGGSIALALVLGGAVPAVFRDRLAVAGTFAQFDGHFGLTPWMDSPLLTGGIAMASLITLGFVVLVVRLNLASTRP